jgi:hypothetical protein
MMLLSPDGEAVSGRVDIQEFDVENENFGALRCWRPGSVGRRPEGGRSGRRVV